MPDFSHTPDVLCREKQTPKQTPPRFTSCAHGNVSSQKDENAYTSSLKPKPTTKKKAAKK